MHQGCLWRICAHRLDTEIQKYLSLRGNLSGKINVCSQKLVQVFFFVFFTVFVLLEATEVRPTCHLLEMWALVHLKANPRWTQIYIYSLSFVNSPSIRGTRYNFMATARMRKIKHGSELRADITWTLHNLLCWHVPWFFPKQNNVWSAQQAREKKNCDIYI